MRVSRDRHLKSTESNGKWKMIGVSRNSGPIPGVSKHIGRRVTGHVTKYGSSGIFRQDILL